MKVHFYIQFFIYIKFIITIQQFSNEEKNHTLGKKYENALKSTVRQQNNKF